MELLKDGHARTLEMLAASLHTDLADIRRKLEYLEHIGAIRRISFSVCDGGRCSECALHAHSDASACKGCLPDGGFQNMGEMWEVVKSNG